MSKQVSSQHLLKSIFRDKLLPIASFLIAFWVFFKNAWVTEDAFILFRSLEQLAIGNGPIWNPHERVQVFTSPLWFWLQAVVRTFSSHVYFNVIAISLALWSGILVILKQRFKENLTFLAVVLLFTASTAFFDYTTSGLENILAYFLIAISLDQYAKLFFDNERQDLDNNKNRKNIRVLFLALGLLACTRHDLVPLFLPTVIYVFYKKHKYLSVKEWVLLSIVALLPLMAWTTFSLLYYGFPFPNTAYAKLNLDLDRKILISQGVNYFRASLTFDLITLPLILSFVVASFLNLLGKPVKPLAWGVLLNLMYVIYVGGDFMQGRFLSYSYMVSVVMILCRVKKFRPYFRKTLAVILILYFISFPHTPLTSPLNYSNPNFNESVSFGIADERGFYSADLSIFNYPKFAARTIDTPASTLAQVWKQAGLEFKDNDELIRQWGNIGLYGYWLGTSKILVDKNALSDPLLARLPLDPDRKLRVGHYPRIVPSGYLESIESSQALIADPQINQFYKQLKLVTQSQELFTWERLKAIVKLNLNSTMTHQ